MKSFSFAGILFFILLWFGIAVPAMARFPYQFKTDSNGNEYIEHAGHRYSSSSWKNKILLKFKNGVSDSDKVKKIGSFGGYRLMRHRSRNFYALQLRGQNIDDVISRLKKDPQIEDAEADAPVFFFQCTPPSQSTDPYFTSGQPGGLCDSSLNNSAWNFNAVNAPAAWQSVASLCPSQPIIVAVIDTGCSSDQSTTVHPDLPSNIFISGFDETTDALLSPPYINTTIDNWGHGTQVTGLIAAQWQNSGQQYLTNCQFPNVVPASFGGGMAGMAGMPGLIKIIEMKTAYAKPPYTFGTGATLNEATDIQWLADGIVDASNNGARVINCSNGARLTDDPMNVIGSAVLQAQLNNSIVVAASGNLPGDPQISQMLITPACIPGVISVGACSPLSGGTATIESYSSYGTNPTTSVKLTLVAPGGDAVAGFNSQRNIFTTALNCIGPFSGLAPGPHNVDAYYSCDNNYATEAGTSFSAPLVTGTIALMLAVNPGLTYTDIFQMLTTTANQQVFGGSNGTWLPQSGYGLLDASAAVALAIPTPGGGGGNPTPTSTQAPVPTPRPTPIPGYNFHPGQTFPSNCNN